MANPYKGMDFSNERMRGIVWVSEEDAVLEEATMEYRAAVGAIRDLECGERKFLPGSKLNPMHITHMKLGANALIKQLAEDQKQIDDCLYGKTYQ